VPISTGAGKYSRAFLSTAITIASMIGLVGVSLYPRWVPSSVDLEYSLTIYNASSTPRTHTTMLIIALIAVPIVLAYTVYIYRVFWGKVTITGDSY